MFSKVFSSQPRCRFLDLLVRVWSLGSGVQSLGGGAGCNMRGIMYFSKNATSPPQAPDKSVGMLTVEA